MNRSETLTHFTLSLLILFTLLGLSSQQKLYWLTTPVTIIAKPLRSPFLSARTVLDNYSRFFDNLPHQQRLIDDLERQNSSLNLTAQQVKNLKKENDSLKSLLAAKVSPNHRVISTQIIGLSRYAIINQGSNSGITNGLPVVINDILVGIITNTFANTAQIRLISDPDTTLPATTLSSKNGQVIFSHNTLQLTQVPQGNSLQVDEAVFTSHPLPNGLLIGKLDQIIENDSSVYQTATIKPATTITQYQFVFVLLD